MKWEIYALCLTMWLSLLLVSKCKDAQEKQQQQKVDPVLAFVIARATFSLLCNTPVHVG